MTKKLDTTPKTKSRDSVIINRSDFKLNEETLVSNNNNSEEACEVFCREGVGASILFKNVTLITRHSSDIIFYKRERIDEYGIGHSVGNKLEKYKWKEYHSLPLEGQISHNKN